MVSIIHATTGGQYQSARELFRAYADTLGFDLEFQGFSRELAELPGDYKPPAGCILLAATADGYAGCVALRPLQNKICEMKRLFVKPSYQGRGIGRLLAVSVIEEARQKGYQRMRLDTIESMRAAQRLYLSLGFKAIDAYCYNPLDNPSFMELELSSPRKISPEIRKKGAKEEKMLISAIVAMASNRVIGNRGDIPWKIPGEQKRFKEITLGHSVIMGRKTYESIGRPLPGRTNIVITRQSDYQADGCIIVHDLAHAFQSCPAAETEAFICGGGQLYQEAMPVTDRIYLTVLPREVVGDTYFPEISEAEFRMAQSEFVDGVEPYRFFIYERIKDI